LPQLVLRDSSAAVAVSSQRPML